MLPAVALFWVFQVYLLLHTIPQALYSFCNLLLLRRIDSSSFKPWVLCRDNQAPQQALATQIPTPLNHQPFNIMPRIGGLPQLNLSYRSSVFSPKNEEGILVYLHYLSFTTSKYVFLSYA
jgi:hypothetical protein